MKHRTRKDRRKQLTGAKASDPWCGNNKHCEICNKNRQHKNKVRELSVKEQLKEYERSL